MHINYVEGSLHYFKYREQMAHPTSPHSPSSSKKRCMCAIDALTTGASEDLTEEQLASSLNRSRSSVDIPLTLPSVADLSQVSSYTMHTSGNSFILLECWSSDSAVDRSALAPAWPGFDSTAGRWS